MLHNLVALGLVGVVVIILAIKPEASALDVTGTNSVSDSTEQKCVCKLLNCECCRSVVVGPINKNLCLNFKLSLLPVQAEVMIKADNTTVAEFSIDAKNPPKYCLPLPLPDTVAACIKLHDIKLIGFSGMQVCSTLYVTVQSNQVFGQKLPCAMLSTTGVGLM